MGRALANLNATLYEILTRIVGYGQRLLPVERKLEKSENMQDQQLKLLQHIARQQGTVPASLMVAPLMLARSQPTDAAVLVQPSPTNSTGGEETADIVEQALPSPAQCPSISVFWEHLHTEKYYAAPASQQNRCH